MRPSEKNKLIGKFWEGNTTRREEEELFDELSTEKPNNDDEAYFHYIAKSRISKDVKEDEIWKTITIKDHRRKRLIFLTTGIAASILLLVSLFITISTVEQESKQKKLLASNNLIDYYKAYGIDLGNDPTLYVNGCKLSKENNSLLQTISPKCVQHISLSNEPGGSGKYGKKNKTVDVWLKGKPDEIYSICEGTLYFYQDGEMKSIAIDDECSPNLLVDCFEVPLSEIKELKPQQIKSIELTTNPRNCNGQLNGEFIVLESK